MEVVERPIERTNYLTYGAAAEYTALSRWTVRRAVRAGELASSGSGRLTRFKVEDLDQWMEQRR